MNGRLPPSLAGRTVRPGGGAGPSVTADPWDGQVIRTTSCPACRVKRVSAITRSSTKKFVWKVVFGVVVSVIASAISGIGHYIVDTIGRLF